MTKNRRCCSIFDYFYKNYDNKSVQTEEIKETLIEQKTIATEIPNIIEKENKECIIT